MGSLDLQLWMRIRAMNRAMGAPVSDPARFKPDFSNAPDQRSALRFKKRWHDVTSEFHGTHIIQFPQGGSAVG